MNQVSSDIFFTDLLNKEKYVNQLLLIDYKRNFKQEAIECPWTYKINIPEDSDFSERIEAINTLVGTIPLITQEVYDTAGFTKPEEVPEILPAEGLSLEERESRKEEPNLEI